jgi:hypothetical protein
LRGPADCAVETKRFPANLALLQCQHWGEVTI